MAGPVPTIAGYGIDARMAVSQQSFMTVIGGETVVHLGWANAMVNNTDNDLNMVASGVDGTVMHGQLSSRSMRLIRKGKLTRIILGEWTWSIPGAILSGTSLDVGLDTDKKTRFFYWNDIEIVLRPTGWPAPAISLVSPAFYWTLSNGTETIDILPFTGTFPDRTRIQGAGVRYRGWNRLNDNVMNWSGTWQMSQTVIHMPGGLSQVSLPSPLVIPEGTMTISGIDAENKIIIAMEGRAGLPGGGRLRVNGRMDHADSALVAARLQLENVNPFLDAVAGWERGGASLIAGMTGQDVESSGIYNLVLLGVGNHWQLMMN